MQKTSRSKCKNQSDHAKILLPSKFSGKLAVIRETGTGVHCSWCRQESSEQQNSLQRQAWWKEGWVLPNFTPLLHTVSPSPPLHLWGKHLVRTLSCSSEVSLAFVIHVLGGWQWWWSSPHHQWHGCRGVSPVHPLARDLYSSSSSQVLSSSLTPIYLSCFDRGFLWGFGKAHFPLKVFLFIFPGYQPQARENLRSLWVRPERP